MFGEPVFRSVAEIPERVDVVDVFRPPAEAETVARTAIEIGAKVLWFQPGTHTESGVELARGAGLTVFFEICMGATHGSLGLTPGPARPEEIRA